MQISMTQDEVALLTTFLSNASSYFEFGMGGSTVLASQIVKDRVYAIDSDQDWVQKIGEEVVRDDKEIRLFKVDIGKTGAWGTPVDPASKHLWPDYSSAIKRLATKDFDLCLVDGRFRVACFLQSLLTLRHDAILAMHDYTIRPMYHVIEEFARPISSVENLSFFVRRSGASQTSIRKMMEAYRTVFD